MCGRARCTLQRERVAQEAGVPYELFVNGDKCMCTCCFLYICCCAWVCACERDLRVRMVWFIRQSGGEHGAGEIHACGVSDTYQA